MHFLRDAFFDLSSCSSQTIILIDNLIGFNDFSIFFELQELYYQKTRAPFGQTLGHYINKNIALSKVFIQTQGYLGKFSDEIAVEIQFILDQKTWQLVFKEEIKDFDQESAWNFSMLFDNAKHEDRYTHLKKHLQDSRSSLEVGLSLLQVSRV